MPLLDLFRKRPPVYVWDDVWEPHVLTFESMPPATEFEWTCDDDHYYHLISLAYSLTLVPILGNVLIWGSLNLGQHRLMTWGHRNWNKLGTLIESQVVIGTRNLVSSVPNDYSYNDLAANVYITPGMRVKLHLKPIVGSNGLDYVVLYLRRWSIR